MSREQFVLLCLYKINVPEIRKKKKKELSDVMKPLSITFTFFLITHVFLSGGSEVNSSGNKSSVSALKKT